MVINSLTSGVQQNYDSEFCGSVPLNYINLIQPHGILLVLQKSSLRILQVSENCSRIINLPAGEIVNRSLEDFIGKNQVAELQEKIQRWEAGNHLQFSFTWNAAGTKKQFSVTAHLKQENLLLELEEIKNENHADSFIHIYQEISYIIAALKEAGSIEDIEEVAAAELKRLSGFDRVMIYKFDEAWNGTVMAEALEDGMHPYLGLRFPASDVPKQARELYFRTPYRLIPDVNAGSVKLYPVMNPLTRSLSDISDCVLRGVPMVHIEYLNNMEVGASMSTPIIVGNQLWGLISCHHRQPKGISFELRSSFEIVSGIISAQLSARQMEKHFRYRESLHKQELSLVERLYGRQGLENALLERPSALLDLLEVSGVVIITEDSYETTGEVPEQKLVRNLVKWLSRFNRDKVFVTDSLPEMFNEAGKYKDVASGLISLQISAGKQYILGFRPELVRYVNWGGNPNEVIKMEEDGKKYHPRNSFKLWKEQVEYTSEPWSPEVLQVADNLRTSVLDKIIRENDQF